MGRHVRDYSNLDWPEAPFGAAQRPFGRRSALLAAFAHEWLPDPSGEAGLAAAAVVYLRLRRDGKATLISDETLSFGFRVTVLETPADLLPVVRIVDQAISRARRHATVVAGHGLEDELTRLLTMGGTKLRGIEGLHHEWASRGEKHSGLAQLVDTATEARQSPCVVHVPNVGQDAAPTSVFATDSLTPVTASVLTRCLAIGLTAATHLDRYRWTGLFHVGSAIQRAGWDLLPAGVASDRPEATDRSSV